MNLEEALAQLRSAGHVPELYLHVGCEQVQVLDGQVPEVFMHKVFQLEQTVGEEHICVLDSAVGFIIAQGFDVVMIFAQKLDGYGTCSHVGVGNYFARWAQIREWCLQQDVIARRETPHAGDSET